MPTVFFSYSHADEALRDQLEKQLAMLKRQNVIDTWHDRRIGAGENIHQVIDDHINTADIILLLVSADFIASDYCYDVEMKRALDRHAAGEAIVIPVILRACDWQHAPFGGLRATPRDGKPVTQWPDIDEAFLQVAQAVREAAGRKSASQAPAPQAAAPGPQPYVPTPAPSGPRTSNLRVAKTFTRRD
ncbi:MAG: toll/interleukin-1 receptor domain-containing protein, partial [Alphaproteobacteria bacterium]